VDQPEPQCRKPFDGPRLRRDGDARRLGAPDIDAEVLLAKMHQLAPDWPEGCDLRPCFFEPTFHKHAGSLCNGIQIHVDHPAYDHARFRPWRLIALAFKALRTLDADYEIWRDFPYEYETKRLAIDVINGGPTLRGWVDDPVADVGDLDALARVDEDDWIGERAEYLLYT
jgi:uncharacterized protein YbbC (DUF1343 family)